MKVFYLEGKNVFFNVNVEGVVNSNIDDIKIIQYIESKYEIKYNFDYDKRFNHHHIYSFIKDDVKDFDCRLHIVIVNQIDL